MEGHVLGVLFSGRRFSIWYNSHGEDKVGRAVFHRDGILSQLHSVKGYEERRILHGSIGL